MVAKKNYWIPKMIAKSEKEGAISLRGVLGIPKGIPIPFTWLEVIRKTPVDTIAHNPTEIGHKMIKVTHLLKLKAVSGLNLKRIGQKKAKKKGGKK